MKKGTRVSTHRGCLLKGRSGKVAHQPSRGPEATRVYFAREFNGHLQDPAGEAELVPRLNHARGVVLGQGLVLGFAFIPLLVRCFHRLGGNNQTTIGSCDVLGA